jgi:multiple sugar transport system substrate-binding protein
MFRRFLMASLAFTGLAVGACGGGGGELVALDRIGREDAQNVVSFQQNQSFTHQATTQSWAQGFEGLFEKWARDNPEWQVDLTVIPDERAVQEQARLLEKARVGRAPDCASVDSFVVPQFVEQGALQPITEHFTKKEINDLFPFVRDIVTGEDGEIYAWWWNTDLRVLYRRTDLVPEAPATWDELISAAQQATKKDSNVDGYLYNGGRWEGTTFDNLAHFWSQGGELLSEKGKPIFAQGRNATYMLNMLKFLKETIDSGASPRRVSTIVNYDDFQAAAAARSVAMFQGGHWQYLELKETLPPEEFEKWEVSELPGREPGQFATGTGGWTIAAFTDDPEKIKMCMDLVKSIYMGPANDAIGQLPTQGKLFDTLETFQDPIFQEFRRQLEDGGKARPGFAIYPEISEQLQVAIGQILTGELTPEEGLEQVAEEADKAYARQQ